VIDFHAPPGRKAPVRFRSSKFARIISAGYVTGHPLEGFLTGYFFDVVLESEGL
jgi:hypothetical protein